MLHARVSMFEFALVESQDQTDAITAVHFLRGILQDQKSDAARVLLAIGILSEVPLQEVLDAK